MAGIVVLLMLISVIRSEQRSISRQNIRTTSITDYDDLLKYIDNEVFAILNKTLPKSSCDKPPLRAFTPEQLKAAFTVHAAKTAKRCPISDNLPSEQTEKEAREKISRALEGLKEKTNHLANRLCISDTCRRFMRNSTVMGDQNPKAEECVERVRCSLTRAKFYI